MNLPETHHPGLSSHCLARPCRQFGYWRALFTLQLYFFLAIWYTLHPAQIPKAMVKPTGIT